MTAPLNLLVMTPLNEPFLSEDDLIVLIFPGPLLALFMSPLDTPAPAIDRDPIPTSPDTQSAIPIDNETVFNAEKLLRSRKRNGQDQYLVKWVGYPLSDATWEPSSNILDPRLLDDFHDQNRDPQ